MYWASVILPREISLKLIKESENRRCGASRCPRSEARGHSKRPSALLVTRSSLVAGAVLGLASWSQPDVIQPEKAKSKGPACSPHDALIGVLGTQVLSM